MSEGEEEAEWRKSPENTSAPSSFFLCSLQLSDVDQESKITVLCLCSVSSSLLQRKTWKKSGTRTVLLMTRMVLMKVSVSPVGEEEGFINT